MKLLNLLLTFIILSSITYAIDYKQIYSGEIKDQGIITADEENFSIYIIRTNDIEKIKVTYPNGQSSLLSENESVIEGKYLVYFDDLREGPDSEFDILAQKYPYYAKIRIEKAEASISFKRTFEKTTFSKGENIKVSVEMENTGSAHVFDTVYQDKYPSNIIVSGCAECQIIGNKVIVDKNLNIGKKNIISYYISSIEAAEFTSNATLNIISEILVDSQEIKIEEAKLSAEVEFSNQNPELAEETEITIKLKNEDVYNFTLLKYKIFFPYSIHVKQKSSGMNQISNYYLYTSPLAAGQEIELKMTVIPQELGRQEIKEEIEYVSAISRDTLTFVHNLDVPITKPSFIIGTISTTKIGQKAEIPIIIRNKEQKFEDVNVKIKTNLPTSSNDALLNELKAGQEIEISKLSFIVPEGKYYLNLTIIYETSFNEILKTELSNTYNFNNNVNEPNKESQNKEGVGSMVIPNIDYESQGISNDGKFMGFVNVPKPIGIVIIIGMITLALVIFLIVKRIKQESMEDLTDSKSK